MFVVPARRIDRVVRELGLKPVDLIEMDIEGTEQYALAGTKQTLASFSPDIIVCVHHLPDDAAVVDQTILSANPAYRSSVQHGQRIIAFRWRTQGVPKANVLSAVPPLPQNPAP